MVFSAFIYITDFNLLVFILQKYFPNSLSVNFMSNALQMHDYWISESMKEHRENGVLWFVIELWTGPTIPACFHALFCYKIINVYKDIDQLWFGWLGNLGTVTVLLSCVYLVEITSVTSGCEDTRHQASVTSSRGSFPVMHMSSVQSSLP